MINGLFLDPRIWKIDLQSSAYWKPKNFGINLELHNDAFNIPKKGLGNKKYDFVITTELWEIPMRKTLKYLKDRGLKVFLMAREPIKYGDAIKGMFGFEKYFFQGEYFFKPDAVFAAGRSFGDIWSNFKDINVYLTGYPRWDWYFDKSKWLKKEDVADKYGLSKDRKYIFFPSFPPYAYQKDANNKDVFLDLFDSRELILRAGIDFCKNNNYQFIVKIHPMSMKCYLKNTGKGNEVSGLLKKYYTNPTSYCKVVGDNRMSGNISKDILCASDLVLATHSTMLLEATAIGTPSVQVMSGNSAAILNPYEGMFPIAKDYEEIINILSGNITLSEHAKKEAEKYIGKIDGKVCQRVCEAIKSEL